MLVCTVVMGSAAPRTAEDIERNIDRLISRMTIEEKIGQLNQLSNVGYNDNIAGQIRNGAVGSILNETDPETVNRLQKEAIENSRLGIPIVFARDVIHGFKTIFPIPLGQAATWNPELVELGARIAADEASSAGIRWTFSPMVDVARDARWGRIAEGAGEDPYLAGRMGAAMVRGYQGNDLSSPNTMAACVKHFAGYGASESGKDYNTTWIPDNLLRDVYLPPFKDAIDAGSATMMCSFNDINGVPSSGNIWLLRELLRNEWGYDGMMVSDWNSIGEMVSHGVCEDLGDAALKAAVAGVDMDMEAKAYISNLSDMVNSDRLPVARVDSMVRNVLRLKYRLGLFDNPYVDLKKANRFYSRTNLDAARRCAAESAVLLKNEGILPIDFKNKRVAVIGPMADAPYDQAGTWSFDLEKEHTVTPLATLRQIYGDNIIYAPGLDYSRELSTDGFDKAVEAAEQADIILFFAGEEAVLSGEAHCLADITLPGAQKKLISRLKETGRPIALVIMAGRPMAVAPQCEQADAVIYMFHPGTMGGPAIADLLSGNDNPSGKLPVSLPRVSGQFPLYYSHKNTGRPAENMTLINDIELEAPQTSTGCTSFYLDAGDGPLFPFGYGLSYTTFAYSDPELSDIVIPSDGNITATCTITNTGSMTGAETVQLYIRDIVGSLARPVKELKDFKKITLSPGESQTVTFTVDASRLGFHTLDGKYIVEPGEFKLWISGDSQSGTPASFKITHAGNASVK